MPKISGRSIEAMRQFELRGMRLQILAGDDHQEVSQNHQLSYPNSVFWRARKGLSRDAICSMVRALKVQRRCPSLESIKLRVYPSRIRIRQFPLLPALSQPTNTGRHRRSQSGNLSSSNSMPGTSGQARPITAHTSSSG
jgi:hypothetical protein